ncbi:MAG: tetratricopeptide repeat protein [Bacillota bacterium]|nr:tetratricopeptide repeat protein [Bacillota bacterium]
MNRKILAIAIVVSVLAAIAVGLFWWFFLRGGGDRVSVASKLSLGQRYIADLKYEQATATLQEVVGSEPKNAEGYLALAQAYRYMGDLDAAKETLQNGLASTESVLISRAIQSLDRETARTGAGDSVSAGEGGGGGSSDTEGSGGSGDSPASPAVRMITVAGVSFPEHAEEIILRNRGLKDSDLAPLAGFHSLKRLDLSGNQIQDLNWVADLKTLEMFYAANNQIVDASPLAALPALRYVGLRGNRIVDAAPLLASSLRYLHLSSNAITKTGPIGKNLKLLYLADNPLPDPASLKASSLLYLDLGSNATGTPESTREVRP